jgi:hypothetical protein
MADMNALQNHAFGQLLAAWHRREDARSAELRQLADARFALDCARAHMRSTISSIR